MIRWLLTHLLFAGTSFFAAGAPAVGGGGAASAPPVSSPGSTGGDSGGSKSITGGDGGAGSDAGSTDTGSAEAGGVGGDTAADFGEIEGFGTADYEPEQQVAEGKAEEFGPEVYKTVKEALKDKPEVFKAVKKAVSMVKRYKEHFESPEAAGEMLGELSTLGGLDSIKQEMGETATFLNGWNAGDADVVSKWIDDNQDGLAKNMPTIIRKWQQVDESGWAHDAAETFMATMLQPNSETGLSPIAALQQLAQIEGVKDSPAFKTLMQRIEGVKRTAAQAPEKKVAEADTAKLSEREKKLQQEEARFQQNMRTQAISKKAAPVLIREAKNALTLVAGTRKLSESARADLLKDIHQEFARLTGKDKDPQAFEKRQKLLAAGQDDQWQKMSELLARRMYPVAARNVWRKYAGIAGISAQEKQQRKAEGQQRTEAAQGATGGPALATKSPGDGRQIDRAAMIAKFGNKDKADDAFLFGSKETGGKRVWIEKGTGTMYTY